MTDPSAGEAGVAQNRSGQSSSTLLGLFAGQFVPAARGVRAPGSPAPADKKALATAIWGAAFADLIQRNLVTVTEVEHKTLFIKSKRLRVDAPAEVTADAETRHGLEHDVLRVACLHRSDKEGIDVEHLVAGLIGGPRPDPWGFTILLAWAYAAESGVGEVNGPDITWDAQKVGALEEPAKAAWAAYQAWLGADPLAGKISSQIEMGIWDQEKRQDKGEYFESEDDD